MKATVHWNLHKGGYSIKFPGQPMQYAASVVMENAEFVVVPSLLRKFELSPNRRTVHAHVRGTIVSYSDEPINGEHIRCNPFEFNCFVRANDQKKAVSCGKIALHANRFMEALDLVVDPNTDTRAQLAWKRTE